MLFKPQTSFLMRFTGAIPRAAYKVLHCVLVHGIDRGRAADAHQDAVELLGREALVPWIIEQVEHCQRPWHSRREVAAVTLATVLGKNVSRGVGPRIQTLVAGVLRCCRVAAGSHK